MSARSSRRAALRIALGAALGLLAAAQPSAQTPRESYPSRPIRIIAGGQAGTVSDMAARLIGERLEEILGTPVVIENHPGAGGTIAAETVAKSPRDGYTLLVAGQSNLVLAQAVGKELRYDPRHDLAPIGLIAHVPFALVVNSKLPVKSVAELVAYAKANPGKLTYATNGPGTLSQMSVELLTAATGTKMLAVPYKGVGSAMIDVVAGRVDVMLTDYAGLAPHVKSGELRLLGAAGARRIRAAPDVPTIAEQGVAGYAVGGWYGLLAPAGTPPDVVARLTAALDQVRRMPDVRQRLAEVGCAPAEDSGAQFRALMGMELEKYTELAHRAGIRAD